MSQTPLDARSNKQLDRSWALAAAVVGLVVIAVHAQTVTFDFVNWDDPLYVVENPAVLDPGQVPWWHHLLTPNLGYPIPVTVLTYQIERALFGLEPAPFHVTNVLLHALVALSILWVSKSLSVNPWAAVGVALLFALHPVAVEPVAWVSGRKEVLAALFTLAAILLMVRKGEGGFRSRILASVFLLLGTLSKPSVAFLPLLFVLSDKPGRLLWSIQMVVHLVLVAFGFVFQAEVGAIGEASGLTGTVVRILASAGHHATALVSPLDLAPKYLDPPQGPEALTLVAGAVAVVVFVSLIVFAVWRRRPAWPWLVVAFLTYAPSSGLIPLNRQYSDSYLYLPLVGLTLAIAASLPVVWTRLKVSARAVLVAGGSAVLVTLGAVSFAHARVYRDGVTLWTTLYARYPDSPQVCRNLGNAWMFGRNQRPERAASVYRLCIETLGNREFFLKNLAVATYASGDLVRAKMLFLDVLRLRSDDAVARKYLKIIENSLPAFPRGLDGPTDNNRKEP